MPSVQVLWQVFLWQAALFRLLGFHGPDYSHGQAHPGARVY